MSTNSRNNPSGYVGGRERSRTRSRGRAVRVWPYYIGATHVTTGAAAQVDKTPTSPPTSNLARFGGLHRPAIGVSTKDQPDSFKERS